MISLAEARAAVTGIKSVTQKPIFVTLTVDKNGRTISGDTLDASLLTLAALGISAFGCNCSVGPADMLDALRPLGPLSAALGIPLIAKPNAGMPHEKEDGTQYFDLAAHEFGEYVPEFIENGIYVLGGCCGTDDSHIAEIRRRIPQNIKPRVKPADITHLACTNKAVDVYKEGTEKIKVTENISDDFLDSEDDVPLLEVTCSGDAEMLLENAYMLDRPFALCGDKDSIALVLRRYNGRPWVI
jgi:5-methyltetrahydrofolate--homocysteine methyltransferase